MLSRWAGAMRLWLMSGGYLIALLPAYHLRTPEAWRVSMALTALMAFVAFQGVLRRLALLSDTPLSRIGSAAQGYVALRGRGLQFEGYPVYAPYRGTPCLWYRYRVEQRTDRKWNTRLLEQSSTSFLVDDGTGRCTVDPEGAEVMVQHRQSWHEGDERFTLELVLPGESVHLLGGFRTQGGDTADLDPRRDTSELLKHWKQDMPNLVGRYDRNADGAIDLQEWEVARQDARREVAQMHQAIRAQVPTHSLGPSSDGRPFVISTRQPDGTVRRFRLGAAAHALIFLMAFGAFFRA